MEFVDTSDDSSPMMAYLVTYYSYLNWTGRRLLTTSSIVPIGLWPLILERAGKDNDKLDDRMRDPKLRAASIYFFLQNSVILSYICSTTLWSIAQGRRTKSLISDYNDHGIVDTKSPARKPARMTAGWPNMKTLQRTSSRKSFAIISGGNAVNHLLVLKKKFPDNPSFENCLIVLFV